MRRTICVVLAVLMIFGNPCMTYAAQMPITNIQNDNDVYAGRATRYFSMGVKANGRSIVNEELSVDVGETIRINATYSPANAEIQIGLVDEDGQFRYVRVTGGDVNITIQISEQGYYRLAVKNNSTNVVNISGYIYY